MWCACLHISIFIHVWVHKCVCGCGGQSLTLAVFLIHFSLCLLRQGLLNPELANLDSPASQLALRIPSLPCKSCDYRLTTMPTGFYNSSRDLNPHPQPYPLNHLPVPQSLSLRQKIAEFHLQFLPTGKSSSVPRAPHSSMTDSEAPEEGSVPDRAWLEPPTQSLCPQGPLIPESHPFESNFFEILPPC